LSDGAVDVVCLGIVVADVVVRPIDAQPQSGTLTLADSIVLRAGGCAVSTSSVLARLGLRSAVLGKTGADAFGDFLVRVVAERGVDGSGIVQDPVVPTSASVVLVDSKGERTFLHTVGASGAVRAGELGEAPFRGRALHIAGALVLEELDGEPTAAILAEARTRGLHTSLDTVFDESGRWSRVLVSLPHCDLVTPGIAEAQGITGKSDPADAARALHDLGAGTAAVTLGPAGCQVCADDFEGHVEGYAVVAVDGTGAGDAFTAGFLYGRLAGWATERCARFANAAGALATTSVGAFEGVGDLQQTLELAGAA
jgi:sugar/nucleoside kinase (ribokinase family)